MGVMHMVVIDLATPDPETRLPTPDGTPVSPETVDAALSTVGALASRDIPVTGVEYDPNTDSFQIAVDGGVITPTAVL